MSLMDKKLYEIKNQEILADSLRLEAVTTCVGFDDILDETLDANMPHLDTMIVVTSHYDEATKAVARKHGATIAETDLFGKHGRVFNKGAAINAGFNHFQYHGWRMHIDSDIIFPDNFRRLLFNHSHLDKYCIYGCDRINVIGLDELKKAKDAQQYQYGFMVHPRTSGEMGARFIHSLYGYVPIGYFQMWHVLKEPILYPHSLGTAARDDVAFGLNWPESHRRLLPGIFVYHLSSHKNQLGENWEGRVQPRLK